MACASGCVCNAIGEFDCKEQLCTYDGPTCWAVGDPHYVTYDSRYFLHHFQGTCEYVLTKPCNDDDYIISTRNDPTCGRPGVACIDLVRVRIPSENFEIVMEQIGRRGRRITLTTNSGTRSVSPYSFVIHTSNTVDVLRLGWWRVHVFLKTRGVRLSYNFRYSVEVTVSTPLMGNVCGLCGTYNKDQYDDFTTPSGNVLSLSEVNAFGDSWEIEGSCGVSRRDALRIVPDLNCTSDSNVTEEARERCGILRRGVFATCNDAVDPTTYIESCEFDYCCCDEDDREDCFCSAVESYASSCTNASVPLSKWRSDDVCRKYNMCTKE